MADTALNGLSSDWLSTSDGFEITCVCSICPKPADIIDASRSSLRQLDLVALAGGNPKELTRSLLGYGGFGEVFSVRLKKDKEQDKVVAVKRPWPNLVGDSKVYRLRPVPLFSRHYLTLLLQTRLLKREGWILAQLQHRNIIRVYGCSDALNMFWLVMDLAPRGTLRGYLELNASADRTKLVRNSRCMISLFCLFAFTINSCGK